MRLRPRRRQPRGYVLVMTLLLLSIAAVALTSIAAESHARALQAVRAQDDLQRRWGALTIHRTLLPAASRVLDPARRSARQPHPGRFSLDLGNQSFVLSFQDEQSKANINTLASHLAGDALGAAVRRLTARRRNVAPLAPAPSADGQSDLTFSTLGQIFGDAPPRLLLGDPGPDSPPGLAARLTCFGDGTLNLKTASAAAMNELAAAFLDNKDFARFRQLRDRSPERPWADILKEINVPPERASAIERLTTATSSCFSLWVVAGADSSRPLYRLAVGTADETTHVFEW